MTATGLSFTPSPAGAHVAARAAGIRPGVLAALVVLFTYAGFALSVDFPRAAYGFQSDEATYYMMGHSLAEDGDLTYTRDDLMRVWKEFSSGPSGVFLKRGRVVQGLRLVAGPPFLELRTAPDPDQHRLYYGKSFAYPLLAAPLVWLFGTNGFLLLHAILLGLMTLAAYSFLAARARPLPSVLLATAYVLASVVPTYAVWITPELFNVVLVTLGYFCWAYKYVASGHRVAGMPRWLGTPASDWASATLLGLATFSKPSNVLLVAPVLIWLLWRRQWRHTAATGLVFLVVLGGLFAANIAVTGEWNFQGGDRRTCYEGFPFQTPDAVLEICKERTTERVLTEVIFGPAFWTVFAHNVTYFFLGRYTGLLPYFFPAVLALVAFLTTSTKRAGWQFLLLGAAVVEILVMIVWLPYTYAGGPVVGNRYFMNLYGLFLFLLPPMDSIAVAILPWLVGGLVTAKITLNPFVASFYPAEAGKSGPLRALPVELSLTNDLPINTNVSRVRVPYGEFRRFQLYFLDDNAYPHPYPWSENTFWVRGESTAEVLVKTIGPETRLRLTITAGAVADRVTVQLGSQIQHLDIPAGGFRRVALRLGKGFPYQGTRVWTFTVTTRHGFVPMFRERVEVPDTRFLGVLVKPELVP